ncbi:MAG: XRE family transcriptional regulator [Chitinophagaceae bacterium]|nr:MAG: XRE family transcriptional regulator [Chitinophagaceae bacterium]
MSQELRARLKAARKKLEFTQVQAAQAWGVPVNTLICWENDQRTPAAFSLKMLNSMLDEILSEKGVKAGEKPAKKTGSGLGRNFLAAVRSGESSALRHN